MTQVSCTNAGWGVAVSPTLPPGITMSRGRISGTPTVPQAKTEYLVASQSDQGTFTIASKRNIEKRKEKYRKEKRERKRGVQKKMKEKEREEYRKG